MHRMVDGLQLTMHSPARDLVIVVIFGLARQISFTVREWKISWVIGGKQNWK